MGGFQVCGLSTIEMVFIGGSEVRRFIGGGIRRGVSIGSKVRK
jgi:hypothetical protein